MTTAMKRVGGIATDDVECACEYIIQKVSDIDTSSAAPYTLNLNIADTWETVTSFAINIGDTWKTVTSAAINIGDSWKTLQ